MSAAKDRRGLIGAAQLFGERRQWVQMVVFEIKDGVLALIAQAVIRRPADWVDGGITARASGDLRGTAAEAWVDDDLIPDVEFHPLDLFLDIVGATTPVEDRLSAAVLRSAGTSALEAYVSRNVLANASAQGLLADQWGGNVVTRRETGRRWRHELKLARIAQRYVELLGVTARPRTVLAKELHLAEQTVQSYLYQARTAGLLTSAGQGKVGGQLTERAIQLLKKEKD